MEPAQLQLILNVVMLTGVTSLAGYCYLLKKENRKLAGDRTAPGPEADPAVVSAPWEAERVEIPSAPVDIRSFAADRRTRWVQSVSSPQSGD
jgi:hypothetical protein